LVSSSEWYNGGIVDEGAVTWGNGNTGITGVVSAANSLVGFSADDCVGLYGVTALTNGNYVVSSSEWDNGGIVDAGAVTWGNGNTGITGVVSAANSLVGSSADDWVGLYGVTALSNGNYVVSSPDWNNGGIVSAGAVTWGNGNTGITGVVSASNSLVGSSASDLVGSYGVTALSNGNYVVRNPDWDNGGIVNAGAVTWGNGNTGITGVVSATNSLVGSSVGDSVGYDGVTALTNGNYVVSSPNWDNGGIGDAGAVTCGNGSTGITGVVSAANSLVGSSAGDQVGYYGRIDEDVVNNTFLTSALHLFLGRVLVGFRDNSPNNLSFARMQGQDLTTTTWFLSDTLNTGTAVTLQANNDFTLNSPLSLNNPIGNGGNLTVQAGRSILLNADIATDNGNLTLSANDINALGTYRDPGSGSILINNGATINTGTGNFSATLGTGASSGITFATGTNLIGNNLSFNSSGTLSLANTQATGNFNATAVGNLTQTAPLNITGNSILSVNANVALDNPNNNFNTIFITGGNNVTLADVNTLDLGTSTISGNLNVNTTGAITDSGTVKVGGTTTLGAGNDITLDTSTNDFSTVAITSGNNVTLADVNTLDLGTSTISGNLSLLASRLSQTGSWSVAGDTTLTTTQTDAGSVILRNLPGIQLGNTVVGGDLTLNSGGTINKAPGETLQVAGSITLNGTDNSITNTLTNDLGVFDQETTLPNGDVVINQVGLVVLDADSYTGNLTVNSLSTGVLSFGQILSTPAITLDQSNQLEGIVRINTAIGAAETITGTPGIVQSGPLTVASTATFNAGSGNIRLADPNNQFNTIAFTGNDVTLVNSGATHFLGSVATANFNLTSAGAVTQSSPLDIGGDTTLNVTKALAGNVDLTNTTNTTFGTTLVGGNFSLNATGSITQAPGTIFQAFDTTNFDPVALGFNTDATAPRRVAVGDNVTITQVGTIDLDESVILGNLIVNSLSEAYGFNNGYTDEDGITLTQANAFRGNLSITTDADLIVLQSAAPAIQQTTALNVGGTVTLNAIGGEINLSNASNQFGALQFGADSVTIQEQNDTNLLNSSATADLSLISGGTIGQMDALTVGGSSSFTSLGGGDIVLTKTNQLEGTIHFNTSGTVELVNSLLPTQLGTSTISQDFNLISGATISQVGNLTVSGLTTLTAGTGDINLTLTGNDFNRVTVNSGNLVSLQDQNALTLGPVKVTAGLLANAVGQLTTAAISTPGGFITLQGQSNINTTAGTLSTSDLLSGGGNIRIEAAGSVNLGNLTTIGQNSASGDITIISQNGSITATGRQIESQSNSVGLGGTGGDITLTGQTINLTGTTLRSSTSGQNDAGSIALSATGAINLLQGTQLVANTSGAGKAGQIRLSGNSLQIAGESSGRTSSISSNVEVGSQGNSGGILANVTGAIQILGGGQLSADTFGQGNAGVIDITTGSLKLQGASNTGIHSSIFSRVNNSGTGDSGGIKITASDQIEILDGALISASTFGQGNAGVVNLSANRLLLQGESPSGLTSGIFSRAAGTSGNSGGIVVNARESIELLGGSQFDASTLGVGDAGIIDLTTKAFRIQGESTGRSVSQISSTVEETARGNSAGIQIQAADSIEILDGAFLSASTFSQGNAGTINLQTANFWAQGEDSAGLGGVISSIVGTGGIGNSGGIVINASDRMELRDGATLTSSTSGQGNAGQISLTATDIVIEGEDSKGNVTSLNSEVERTGTGDSGGITLNASNSIQFIDGVFLTSTTLGKGNAGRIQLTAPNIIAEGQNSTGEGVNIFSQLDQSLDRLLFGLPLAEGSAGGISITASDSLQLLDGATLSSGTFGNGDAGAVEVTANSIVLQGEGRSLLAGGVNPGGIGNLVGYGAVGNSGTIKLSTGSLSVLDGATISSSTLGNGEAGLIDIQARDSVQLEGKGEFSGFASRIISTVEPGANGGSQGIQINTALLSLDDGSSISASNGNNLDDLGLSTIVDILKLFGLIDLGQGNAGGITLNTNQLNVANGSIISSSTDGRGSAGTVTINATEGILLNQGSISTAIESQGVADQPSNIIINTSTQGYLT